VQSNLNRSLGYLQQLGDRRLRHVLAIAQLQQCAIALVEPLEGGVKIGALNRGDRLRADTGTVAKGLVANDRRQPFVATFALAQSRLSAPGTEQGVLCDVLGFARVAGVAIGNPKADPVCFPPLPAVARIALAG
jgi:hypothetical protein